VSGGPASGRPDVPPSRQVHVDVRDDIRRGEEPFARIMGVVHTLGPDHVLVLRAPFEPRPLYAALGKRGFAHWTERLASDDWTVWFHRGPAVGAAPGSGDAEAADAPAASPEPEAGVARLDVRGLEPPGPMVQILEAVERLAPGQRLEVLHERRPVFLYPQLDERGFVHETDEPSAGVVRIVIRRAASA
jgi:uncharacterized protein (DUF2249 family)